jgi:hypothetical protein
MALLPELVGVLFEVFLKIFEQVLFRHFGFVEVVAHHVGELEDSSVVDQLFRCFGQEFGVLRTHIELVEDLLFSLVALFALLVSNLSRIFV